MADEVDSRSGVRKFISYAAHRFDIFEDGFVYEFEGKSELGF